MTYIPTKLDRLINRMNVILHILRLPHNDWDSRTESSRRALMLELLDEDYFDNNDTIIYDIFMQAFNAKTEELGVKGCDFSFNDLLDIFDKMPRYAKLIAFS